ncbi:tetratricopeptide repeat protein [Elusimicrobiota bacterium]
MSSDKEYSDKIERAKTFIEKNEYTDALNILKDVIQHNPENADAHFEFGKVYHLLGKNEQAVSVLNKSLEIEPDNSYACLLLGKIFRKLDKPEASLKYLTRAVEHGQHDHDIFYELGVLYRDTHNFPQAIQNFQKTIIGNDNASDTHYQMGSIYYYDMHDPKKAIKEFVRSITLGNDRPEVHLDLGRAYVDTGKYDEAIKEFNCVLKTEPSNPQAFMGLAMVCDIRGDYKTAISNYEKALKIEDSYTANRNIGRIHYIKGDYDTARKLLKKAIDLNPDDEESHFLMGSMYEKQQEYDKAVNEYRKTNPKPDDKNIHLVIGRACLNNKDYRAAEKEFLKVISIDKDDSVANNKLAIIYQELRQYDKAIAILAKDSSADTDENERYRQAIIMRQGEKSRRKLKIRLIRTPEMHRSNTRESFITSLIMPLGMLQIASYLKKYNINIEMDDINVKIFKDNLFGEKKKKISTDFFCDEKDRIIAYSKGGDDEELDRIMQVVEDKTDFKDCDVILLSVPELWVNRSAILFIFALSRYLKEKYNPIVVVGGSGLIFSDLLEENSSNMDLLIRREGEKPLFKILTALEYGLDIRNIPDITEGKDTKTVEGSQYFMAETLELFGLPIELYGYKNNREVDESADREVANIIHEFNDSGIIVGTFRLIHGCPHGCIFCGSSNTMVSQVLPIRKAVDYLKKLREEYNIKNLFFLDSTVNSSKRYLNDFCDALIKNKVNVHWSNSARPDNLDRDLLMKMREAGCIRLIYGMETASPEQSIYLDKRISFKRLEKILQWSDEAGIWAGLETIIGFPHEKKRDKEILIDFIKRNKRYINTPYYNIFSIVANSKIYSNPEAYGITNVSYFDSLAHEKKGLLSLLNYSYDEIGGMKWEEKFNKILGDFEYVYKQLYAINDYFPPMEIEHFIFFLFEKYGNKKEVSRVFKKVQKYLNRDLGPDNILNWC